jgi:hypothetical protein
VSADDQQDQVGERGCGVQSDVAEEAAEGAAAADALKQGEAD